MYKLPMSSPFQELSMLSTKEFKKRGYIPLKIHIINFTNTKFEQVKFDLPDSITGKKPKKTYTKNMKIGGHKIDFTTSLCPKKGIEELQKLMTKNHPDDVFYIKKIWIKDIETGAELCWKREKAGKRPTTIMALRLKLIKTELYPSYRNRKLFTETELYQYGARFAMNNDGEVEHCKMSTIASTQDYTECELVI